MKPSVAAYQFIKC